MDKVASLSDKERQELFSDTAYQKGMTPAAIEKDFWICWVLMKLFGKDEFKRIFRFKGGTTLSKCFNIIDRFSEDIDLVLDWTELKGEDPLKERSTTQQDKFNKSMNVQAAEYLASEFVPVFRKLIDPHCDAKIDSSNKQAVNVSYPIVFDNRYLRPEVKLEIGPLGSMVPSNEYSIKSYAAEVYPEFFDHPEFTVNAITVERTFWEKVTILHVEAHRPVDKPQPPRYSRHYYDVYKMLNSDIVKKAMENIGLLEEVVNFKEKFYYSSWSRYDLAVPGTIKLLPDKTRIKTLNDDYRNMEQMIFGDFVEFDKVMDSIAVFEDTLNKVRD